MSIVGVSLVTVPYAIARLLISSRAVRWASILSLIAYASTRNYRRGEGPLSPKMIIYISPGDGMGGILHDWGRQSTFLNSLRGETICLTASEAQSLGLLIQAVQESKGAIHALIDFLQNFPRR